MALLYFLNGVNSINARALAADGRLAHAIDVDTRLTQVQVHNGPGKMAGTLFALRPPQVELNLRYRPDEQTWEPYPGSDDLWLGFPTEAPPDPAFFARAQQVRGHPVRLGDGREWEVPVIRAVTHDTRLPRRMVWDGEQFAPDAVIRPYEDLYAEAGRMWDDLAGEEQLTIAEEALFAARGLAVNYRLGPAEIGMLGLLTTATEVEAVKAMLDWPLFEALKKKQVSAAPDSTPGDGDSSPDTPPASSS